MDHCMTATTPLKTKASAVDEEFMNPALKGHIMAEMEVWLAQKEENLWRRGQVEIKKMQLDHQNLKGSVDTLMRGHASLVCENQKLHSYMMKLTSSSEYLREVLRDVLRGLPQTKSSELHHHEDTVVPHLSPSPSVTSTSASEVRRGCDDSRLLEPTPGGWSSVGTEITSGSADNSFEHSADRGIGGYAATASDASWRRHPGTPASSVRRTLESALDQEAPLDESFCTPRRTCAIGYGAAVEDASVPASTSALPLLNGLSLSHTPSPALSAVAPVVPVSLVSALPLAAASGVFGTPQQPSPGFKRLQLARCLEDTEEQDVHADAAAAPMKPPMRFGGCVVESNASLTLNEGIAALPVSQHAALPPLPQHRSEELITVELIKEPGFVTLGIEVNQVDEMLCIEGIDEHGLVASHNLGQGSDSQRVKCGDRLVEVNGIRHDPDNMLAECKARSRLVFVLERCAGACQSGGTAVPTPHQHFVMVPTASTGSNDNGIQSAGSSVRGAAATSTRERHPKASSPGTVTRLRPEAPVFTPTDGHEATPAGMQTMTAPPGL